MASDAFIGILSGLGEAHRARQKNIFDQEVDRRSKYEQFLQKASTDPAYRPEAQNQFAELYSTLIQTPYEKKLPKDFERQVTDALTSVEGSSNLSQGGPAQVAGAKGAAPGLQQATVPEPAPFQGKVPSRFSADEKFAEAMRLLNAQLQARGQSEVETERQKIAMQPDEAFPFSAESGLATRSGKVLREPELKPVKPPAQPNLEAIEITLPGQSGPVPAMRNLDPDNPVTVGKIFVRTPQGLQDVTAQAKLYQKPVQPPATIRIGESMDTDTWTNLVSTGQIELNDVPNAIARDKVAQEMAKRGLLSVPKAIREQITTNLEPAKSLIGQVEGLANKIMRGEDRAMNTVLLQQQTAALGTLLGRMIGGERGVITDRDREVAVGLLPGWVGTNFASSYVQKQMAYIKERLRTQEQAYRQGYFQQFSASGVASPTPSPAAGGAGKAPAGVDQAVWDVMTPQERALWK